MGSGGIPQREMNISLCGVGRGFLTGEWKAGTWGPCELWIVRRSLANSAKKWQNLH
jgi:hypothetical protein